MSTRQVRSTESVSGRREHRKHVTRRELLAAGRRLFAERGLYDSRIEDLSRMAGIAKGTLYGYFVNKEELVEAVVTSGFSELLGHVHRTTQGASSRDAAIERIAEAHLAFFAENPDLMRIFHQVRGLLKFDQGSLKPLRTVLQKYITGLVDILGVYRGGRTISAARDREVALLLFGAASGITSVRAALQVAVPRGGDARTVVRSLVGLVNAYELPSNEVVRAAGAGRPPRHPQPPRRPPAPRRSVPRARISSRSRA